MGSVETMKALNKKELVKALSYIVMSDGGLYVAGRCTNASFAMNMKKEHMDFVEWCQWVVEHVTSCTVSDRKLSEDGYNRQPQVRLQSKTHPQLTTLRDRIYTDGYKGIDPHALKLLDAQALAILYMCDGSFVTYRSKGSVNDSFNVTLNLKRLSYGDQFILKKALKEMLDLEWNINRQGNYYYLRLRGKEIDKFMEMVAPHVLPSFQYKIKECFRVVSP